MHPMLVFIAPVAPSLPAQAAPSIGLMWPATDVIGTKRMICQVVTGTAIYMLDQWDLHRKIAATASNLTMIPARFAPTA